MIETIVNVAYILKNTVYYTLLLSYQTGQVIINVTLWLGWYFKNAFDIITTLVKIGCEDFEIFVWDILENVGAVIGVIVGTMELALRFLMSINGGIKSTCEIIYYTITTTYFSILASMHKIGSTFMYLVVCIKYIFVLLGSGVWFAMTIIPVCIFYGSILFTYYIGLIFGELGDFMACFFSETAAVCKSIIGFFWDIPLEAMLGLIFISCIVYSLSKFYMMVYRFCNEKLYTMKLIFRYSYLRVLTLLNMPNEMKVSNVSKETLNGEEELLFCVICQERQKCVLILPCKHLCMCKECNKTMQRFYSNCPICRSKVEKTMTVFV